jgi:hypothetical protein
MMERGDRAPVETGPQDTRAAAIDRIKRARVEEQRRSSVRDPHAPLYPRSWWYYVAPLVAAPILAIIGVLPLFWRIPFLGNGPLHPGVYELLGLGDSRQRWVAWALAVLGWISVPAVFLVLMFLGR